MCGPCTHLEGLELRTAEHRQAEEGMGGELALEDSDVLEQNDAPVLQDLQDATGRDVGALHHEKAAKQYLPGGELQRAGRGG